MSVMRDVNSKGKQVNFLWKSGNCVQKFFFCNLSCAKMYHVLIIFKCVNLISEIS